MSEASDKAPKPSANPRWIDAAEYRDNFGVPEPAIRVAPAHDPASAAAANAQRQHGEPVDEPEASRDALPGRLPAALEQARDARKFEIEMYWKRATYFWAFIATAFAGYAAFFNASPPHAFAAFMVSMIGLVFTYAWYLVNRGSKFWQENWENHVELLEDAVTGPLFKTVTERPTRSNGRRTWEDRFIGPLPVSVSKINGVVSLFLLMVWAELAVAAGASVWNEELTALVGNWSTFILWSARFGMLTLLALPAALAVWWLRSEVASHRDAHNPKITVRTVSPTPPPDRVQAASEASKRECGKGSAPIG